MGTVTVSLDKIYTKKAEIIRTRCYPNMMLDDAVREFVKDSLNAQVPDEEVMDK